MIRPGPEDVFTRAEAEIIEKANAGKLLCPQCGQAMSAKLIVTIEYSGVMLYCPNTGWCGFKEF